ncbi:hypothetical protein FA95DRAFT_1503927, partial [Auriscalpium vulgare]
MELILSGLNRPGASQHAARIVEDFNRAHPAERLPPLRIAPVDNRDRLDYVSISLDPDLSPEPRPDVLEAVRQRLDGLEGLRASWRISPGPDRSRRIWFQADDLTQANILHPRLKTFLEEHNITYQSDFVFKSSSRVYFEVTSHDAFDTLKLHPPVFERRTFPPSRARFVQPCYGLEIAISGCSQIPDARRRFDAYIHNKYGPVVASSRLCLDGDVYCVVLKTWSVTARLLKDEFTAIKNDRTSSLFIDVVPPFLLYFLNGQGLPSNSRFLQYSPNPSMDPALHDLRAEVDSMREQGQSLVKTISQLASQHSRAMDDLRDQNQRTLAAVSTISASVAASTQLNAASATLESLRSERRQLQLMSMLAGNPEIVQQLTEQAAQLDNDIARQDEVVKHERQQVLALQQAVLPTLAPPGIRAPPPPSTSARTSRAREESPEDSASAPPPRRSRMSIRDMVRDSQEDMDTDEQVPSHSPGAAFPSHSASSALRGDASPPIQTPSGPELVRSSGMVPSYLTFAPPRLVAFAFIALLLLSLSTPALSSQTLHAVSVNANGLHDDMKTHAISGMISQSRPHIWSINETKSRASVASRLHTSGYSTFESHGQPARNSRSSKWGVIVGVRRDLQAQSVPVPSTLSGRVVATDIIIPTAGRHGFIHRVIAVYAPWNPGGDEPTPGTFWPLITDLCRSASHSWSVIGDCNVTLTTAESQSGSHLLSNRTHFLSFLNVARGHDLWSDQPDRDVASCYTYRGPFGSSIIDRAIHSNFGVLSGQISSTSTPRFLHPKRTERHRFDEFSRQVDGRIRDSPVLSAPIINDDISFSSVYSALTDVLLESAKASFQLPRAYAPGCRLIRNPTIAVIVTESKRLGRLIYAARQTTGAVFDLARRAPWVYAYLHAHQSLQASGSADSFLTFLIATQRLLSKLRYREERHELRDRAIRVASAQINSVLLGGSSKRLYSRSAYSSPPLALVDPDNPSLILTDPPAVKSATRDYFSRLYHHDDIPADTDKPWLQTHSVEAIRQRTAADPFQWPRPMSLSELRCLLRKGNQRPSPGPDKWEKWFVTHLSDTALTIVLELLNYEISRSHFPDVVKPSTLSTIHKRGSKLDLANYRGVESWAHRERVTVFALRRDQQKGFDRLSPEGFYDAISAYGLPSSIADLDSSAQTDVP